jgi:ribokinase
MKNIPKILVVGSFVMDLIVSSERFPNAGQTVLGMDYRTAPGGKGANQSVQMARLGADVTMVGKIGDDDFGKRLIDSCQEAGVHIEHIVIDPLVPSAVGNVQLEIHDGEIQNRIIVVPGANMTITPENVVFLKEAVAGYDMVVLQLEIPMAISEIVAKYAFDKGVPVMLNSAPSAPLSPGLLSYLTYISPNEHEATDLTQIPIRRKGKFVNQEDVKAAVNCLLSKGVKNAVITLGSAGAVVANQNEIVYEPCIDVVDVKDPTAAGDSFVGAFTVGVCAGLSNRQALNFANYTAALTVSRIGAQPSLPFLSEVLNLMEQEENVEFDAIILDALKSKKESE